MLEVMSIYYESGHLLLHEIELVAQLLRNKTLVVLVGLR